MRIEKIMWVVIVLMILGPGSFLFNAIFTPDAPGAIWAWLVGLAIFIALGLGVFVVYYKLDDMRNRIFLADYEYLGLKPDDAPAYRQMSWDVSLGSHRRNQPLNRAFAALIYNANLIKAFSITRNKELHTLYTDEAYRNYEMRNAFLLWGDYATGKMPKDVSKAISLERKLQVSSEGKPFPLSAYLFMLREHTPENIQLSQTACELGIRPDYAALLKKCSEDELQQFKELPPDLITEFLK